MVLAMPQGADTTRAVEGVWHGDGGVQIFIGNGRVDWSQNGSYYTSMLAQVPDGSLLGPYWQGEDVATSLDSDRANTRARDPQRWWGAVPHLYPTPGTSNEPRTAKGEVRLTVLRASPQGAPYTIALDVTPAGKSPRRLTFVRSIPFASLTMMGAYEDKETRVEVSDGPGRTGEVRGTLTYRGRRLSFGGRRIMGRAGIRIYDDSRLGGAGEGYLVWAPSADRAVDLREKRKDETDRIDVYFRLADGSTATGIHKTLGRMSSG